MVHTGRYRYIHLAWKGPGGIHKAFNTRVLPRRAQAEPQRTRCLEGWRSWVRTPEMARRSCHSPSLLRVDPVPGSASVSLTSYPSIESRRSDFLSLIDHFSKVASNGELAPEPQSHGLSTRLFLGGIAGVGCAGRSAGGTGRNTENFFWFISFI